MNKLGIIVEREYLRRVSKKSFILLTVFLPFFICGADLCPFVAIQYKK